MRIDNNLVQLSDSDLNDEIYREENNKSRCTSTEEYKEDSEESYEEDSIVESISSEGSNVNNNDPNHKSKYMYNRSQDISGEKGYLGKRNIDNMEHIMQADQRQLKIKWEVKFNTT